MVTGRQKQPSVRFDRLRIGSVLLLFGVGFGLVVKRLVSVQLFDRAPLLRAVARQYPQKKEPLLQRGTIYSRNGTVLATTIPARSIYMIPQKINRTVLPSLAESLAINYNWLQQQASSKKKFIWLKRKATPQQIRAVRALSEPGIGFQRALTRVYINKRLAGQVLGFVGLDNQGLAGLEYRFEKQLSPPEAGVAPVDIRLTIDEKIQRIAEKALQAACEKHQPQDGMALVMDPQTGELLALAIWPFCNPNRKKNCGKQNWRNNAVSSQFEPGSIMKIFTAVAALEEGIYQPTDQLFCHEGVYKMGRRGILRDSHAFAWLSFAQVIQHSSNIGIMKVAEDLGKEQLYAYLKQFGFGRKTGISLPGEVSGTLRPLKQWSSRSLGSIAFGQEIAVTGLQFLTAYSSIISGGTLLQPRIILGKAQGTQERALSKSTCDQIKKIMVGVVEKGTGKQAQVAGYQVGGKTGTAQKYDRKQGRYSQKKYIASFVGFAPAEQPLVTVLVVLNEPSAGDYYGGSVAAPVFRQLITELFHYWDIPPDTNSLMHQQEKTLSQLPFSVTPQQLTAVAQR